MRRRHANDNILYPKKTNNGTFFSDEIQLKMQYSFTITKQLKTEEKRMTLS